MNISLFKSLSDGIVLFDSYEQISYTKRQIIENMLELWNIDYDGHLYPDHFITYKTTYISHITLDSKEQK